MSDDKVTITIDGQTVEARKGAMLIEATDAAGRYVPRFCYHKKLSIAASCRMCLVDVENMPKTVPACATPIMDGMVVHTGSDRAKESQKAVMEFLLINHPLDCPICDQGGECELQDLAVGYGGDVSVYTERKRVVKDKNIGPLVQTDMTRCIHCTRCVRFGEEVAGLRELGATGRGENMQIGTYIEKSMNSEMSGNIIDVCPVGALTSKPFRFSARAWELRQADGVAAHDSVGSAIHMHLKGSRVKRVVPRENEAVNEVWISDRDRFSYEGLYSEDRLTTPMIKQNGAWQSVDWETALDRVEEQLGKLISDKGADAVGALASPSSTLEELYLLQKYMRVLGPGNVDHRLRQTDFSDQSTAPLFPALGVAISDLEQQDAVLLIGSNCRKEQPILNHRLRKAAMRGAEIMVVNQADYNFNMNVAEKVIAAPAQMVLELAGVAKALLDAENKAPADAVAGLLGPVSVEPHHKQIANRLSAAEKACVLLGNQAIAAPQLGSLRALAGIISELTGASLGYLSEAANSAGAWLAGAVPHREAGGAESVKPGKSVADMLEQGLDAAILLNIEPELDAARSRALLQMLDKASFVVSLTSYKTPAIEAYADVLLPVSQFAETSGSYINCEGKVQSFAGAVAPQGDARPAWKVLRVMANKMALPGFNYQSSEEVRDEVLSRMGSYEADNQLCWQVPDKLPALGKGIQAITEVPACAIDPLVRRANALQQTQDVADGMAHLNQKLATELGLTDGASVSIKQGDTGVTLPVRIDATIADACVLIHSGQAQAAELDDLFGTVTLAKD